MQHCLSVVLRRPWHRAQPGEVEVLKASYSVSTADCLLLRILAVYLQYKITVHGIFENLLVCELEKSVYLLCKGTINGSFQA